jgi:hypothetical protein
VHRRGFIFDAVVESRGFGSPDTTADGLLSLEDQPTSHDASAPLPKHKADNLPEPLTTFIGRERELADVAAILEELAQVLIARTRNRMLLGQLRRNFEIGSPHWTISATG